MAQIVINVPALDQLQRDRGWTSTQLAAAIGVSVSEVWRVKNGGGQPGNRFIAGLIKLSGKQMPFCDLVI